MGETFMFEGFEPSDELKAYAKEILWYIEDKSPSQSARQALIRKTDLGFEGELKVSSLAGIFAAKTNSSDPMHTVEELYGKIREVLGAWSRSRA